MRRSKVPLNVGGESKRVCCKAELVRVTSQISVEIGRLVPRPAGGPRVGGEGPGDKAGGTH